MNKLSSINEGIFSQMVDNKIGKKKRDSEYSRFDMYLESIEWVDLGHKDYLFEKGFFLKRPDFYEKWKYLDKEDLFSAAEMYDIQHSLPDDIDFLPKSTYWWLVEKNDYKLFKKGYENIKVEITKPGTDISIDLPTGRHFEDRYTTFVFRHHNTFGLDDKEYDYRMDFYMTSNTDNQKYVALGGKKARKSHYIVNPNEYEYLFKLVKFKPRKTKK